MCINAGIRMDMGAYRSSSISSIFNLAGVSPLEFIRLTLKYELKLVFTLLKINLTANLNKLESLLKSKNLRIADIVPSILPSLYRYCNRFISIKKDSTNTNTYEQHYYQFLCENSGEKTYTDTSKSQASVGAAVV